MPRWQDILGHQRVLTVLQRAIEHQRLHHAYLFTGPEGVGKATVARLLTMTLNCLNRPDQGFQPACGECSACRRIAAEQHPDFLVPEVGRTIKIDAIRAVQKASISAPYEARLRVVLIDDAHLMTEEAANALLKTLEEPPDRMLLLLVTDQPHRLLDTILSRCQRLRFGRLPTELVAAALPDLWEGAPSELLQVAAGYGEGSLGRSLSVLDSGILEARREILSTLVTLSDGSPKDWIDEAAALGDSSGHLGERLDVLLVFFRDVLLTRNGLPERVVNKDLQDLVDGAAQRFSTDATLALLDAIMLARRRLDGYVNSVLLAEDLVDRLRSPDHRALAPV